MGWLLRLALYLVYQLLTLMLQLLGTLGQKLKIGHEAQPIWPCDNFDWDIAQSTRVNILSKCLDSNFIKIHLNFTT